MSTDRTSGSDRLIIQSMPDAAISQANPVSGTAYTVLDTRPNVKLVSIMVKVTWTVQPTPLQVIVTVDGKTITFGKGNPVSATEYYPIIYPSNLDADQGMDTSLDARGMFAMENASGRSVRVQAKTTGGTVSNLSCTVKYAKW